jgi:hypothetical protein
MRSRSTNFIFISIGTLFVTGFMSCGSGDPLGRHAISGTVNVDGAPVKDGNISFQPVAGAATSSGAPIADGKFDIERAKGLPPGKYRVSINAPKPNTGGKVDPNAMPGDPVAPPEELIPPEWNMKSQETIEVKPEGPFEFKFDISTKKK